MRQFLMLSFGLVLVVAVSAKAEKLLRTLRIAQQDGPVTASPTSPGYDSNLDKITINTSGLTGPINILRLIKGVWTAYGGRIYLNGDMACVTDATRRLMFPNGLPMGLVALISLVAFAASLTLTAVVRAVARRWDIVDRPDGQRKLHARPVPLLGGVAVYGATVLGLLAVHLGTDVSARFTTISTAWMLAAGFVCLVGCVDDCFNLPSRLKLVLQILSVLPIVLSKCYIGRIVAFGCPIELGWLGIPLTVIWLVGCINALNLLDGMDGLASTVGLSTAAMLGLIAASQGQYYLAMMALTLAAALAGFLMFNLPPASIFLGDSGSMVIGLTIGMLGIQGGLKTSATLAITAPAVMMTLPMFDVVAALVRRRLTGRRFDDADRLHIHHRLLDRGWSPWQVLCLAGAICLTMGAAATAATIFRRDALAWIAAMTLVVLMIRLRLFGHDEFALAKETVIRRWKLSAGFFARLARKGRVHGSEFVAKSLQAGVPQILVPEPQIVHAGPQTMSPEPWNLFLSIRQAWKIRQAESGSLRDGRQRPIRWSDPAAMVDEPRAVPISVLLPGGDEEAEEALPASRGRPPMDRVAVPCPIDLVVDVPSAVCCP